jgi:hypothetical protein
MAGITEMAAANRYLTERFLPAYNRRVAVPAPETGTALVPWIGTHLADILCVQEDRVVAKDNTVHYQGKRLPLPPYQYRFHYVKVLVRVHAYPDASLAVFHGLRCLARSQPDGQLMVTNHTPLGRRRDPTPKKDRTTARSSSVGQRCPKIFERAIAKSSEERKPDTSCATKIGQVYLLSTENKRQTGSVPCNSKRIIAV